MGVGFESSLTYFNSSTFFIAMQVSVIFEVGYGFQIWLLIHSFWLFHFSQRLYLYFLHTNTGIFSMLHLWVCKAEFHRNWDRSVSRLGHNFSTHEIFLKFKMLHHGGLNFLIGLFATTFQGLWWNHNAINIKRHSAWKMLKAGFCFNVKADSR